MESTFARAVSVTKIQLPPIPSWFIPFSDAVCKSEELEDGPCSTAA